MNQSEEEKITDFVTGKTLRNTPEEQVRQTYEKRLVEEYGYSKDQIEIEFTVQKGSKRIGPADIVVFRDPRRKVQEGIWIIVETKRKERSDGIDQLKTYLSPCKGAKYGVWFNGKEIAYVEVLDEPPYFEEVLKIPKKGETTIRLPLKKELKPATELKSVFETCHNYIYANEGLLKEKVFNEVLKLIFIKMVDEKSSEEYCRFGITKEEEKELKEGKKSKFTERINELFNKVKRRQYSDVFDPYESINIKPLTLAFVVSQLQDFNLIETPVDVKGIAFQTFVYAHQRGERGEFFTPRPIVELVVDMLRPKDGEMFLDPACGSGGFLVRGMNSIKEDFENRPDIKKLPEDVKREKVKNLIRDYAHTYIRGIDINPDLAKVAKMHMVLYDDGHTGIFTANSLESLDKLNETSLKAKSGELKTEFKVLMTNPPFGSKGKVTDRRILRQFDLGYKWKKDKRTGRWRRTDVLRDGQVPDILFIERCLQFLQDEGRMAIVLPNGDLNNSTLEYVREFIKTKARIVAVVSLPVGTFMSAGSNPQPSVLFLQKLGPTRLEELTKSDYPVFMAIAEKIGYDLKTKTAPIIYKRTDEGELVLDKDGNPTVDTDIPDIANAFYEFKRKHSLSF